MKRVKLGILIGLGILAGVWAAAQVVSTATQSLSKWMPGGALFYLESSDFGTQLRDWNRSGVKTKWLAGKNYEHFLTTRLVLKLNDAFDEFSGAAGFAPNIDALETFAGTESALAVYDIGRLELVYISKLPSAQLAQNALTRVRDSYQTRSAAGRTYYARQAGGRTAAYAISGDYVVVSTREDLLTAALELIGGSVSARSVSQDTWFDDAVRAMGNDASRPVALRLVMDMPNVIRTPYFRSYWIQKNTADLRSYSTFLSQITRTADAYEENRVFVRSQESPVTSHDAASVALQRSIPDGADLVRLWDTASTDLAMEMIREKFFAAGPGIAAPRETAPGFNVDGVAGQEADLQTRIDEAPKPALSGSLTLEPLRKLVDAAGMEAMLHLESSLPSDDTTFVRSDVALALRASSPWNKAAVQSALTSAVASYQSVDGIGLQWRDVTSEGRTLSQWDGLVPLTMFVDGQTLWIGRSPGLLVAALNRSAGAAPQPAAYFARYSHRAELAPYMKMMRMLDLSDQPNYSNFFSENIGSLATTVDTIQSMSVKINDSPLIQRQVLRYELSR